RLAPRPLLGEVLPRGDPLPRVRRGERVHVPVGRVVPGRADPPRPRRDGPVRGGAGRGARLRLAKEGNRMGLEFTTSRLADAIAWARKFSLFTYPFVTACCGMEFMAVAGPKHDIARFGAEFPRFSPRQADLLMIVG